VQHRTAPLSEATDMIAAEARPKNGKVEDDLLLLAVEVLQ
jgi:hypothetical protein